MRGKHASAPKPDRRGRRLWGVVFWLALAVCIVAVSVLGFIFYSFWSAEKGYDDLAGKAFDAQDVSGTTLADMTVDWDYLRSVNGDVVAWVYVPGTNINYPVVQTGDNETYLTMDFNQSNGFSARCGSIFLDCNNDPGFADANNLLYGHHMNDGSMFAAISKQLTDEAQFNACRYVYVLTPDCNYQCETFALVITDGWDALVETEFPSDDERIAYIADKQERSVVQPSEGMPDPASIEKMITLSTCDYTKDNGRAVLFSQVVSTAVPGGSGGAAVDQADIDSMRDAGEAV